MTQRESTKRLIIDVFFLAASLILLMVDLLISQDILLTIIALLGTFIFSTRVGRDVRRLRTK